MSMRKKIESLEVDVASQDFYGTPQMHGYNNCVKDAVKIADEADNIMEKMAAILDEYDLGDAMDIITVYNDWKDEGWHGLPLT